MRTRRNTQMFYSGVGSGMNLAKNGYPAHYLKSSFQSEERVPGEDSVIHLRRHYSMIHNLKRASFQLPVPQFPDCIRRHRSQSKASMALERHFRIVFRNEGGTGKIGEIDMASAAIRIEKVPMERRLWCVIRSFSVSTHTLGAKNGERAQTTP